MNQSLLELKDVTMQFGGVVAVNNFSMHVNEGEIVALIGPNGAGKTTAFNCITGVYEPTNGEILYRGHTVSVSHPHGKMKKLYAGLNADLYSDRRIIHPTPDEITKLGIARTFQNIRLFKSMTVYDNVLTAMHLRARQNVFSAVFRISYKEERRMREDTERLLKEQDLYKYKDEKAIARALATEPELLLLDEPAAGMNPQETKELASFIKEIKERYNLTVFMIEHHMDLVMEISDRIYVLDFGSPIAEGTPDEIQNNDRVIKAYLGESDEI